MSTVITTAPEDRTASDAARLRLSITRLHRLLRQHSSTDLTLTQVSTLASVLRHGPLTLGALAAVEQVAPPTITKVVGKLEDHGLVARTIDAADRRVCRVAVTPAGDAYLAEVRESRNAWLATRLEQLAPGDQQRIAEALAVLERLAEDATAPDPETHEPAAPEPIEPDARNDAPA